MLKPNITQDEQDYRDGTYSVSRKCSCGTETHARVDGPGLFAYNRGALVQDAFSALDADTREALFLSGRCPKCWGQDEDSEMEYMEMMDEPDTLSGSGEYDSLSYTNYLNG